MDRHIRNRRAATTIAACIVVLFFISAVLFFRKPDIYLELKGEQGQIYLSLPAEYGDEFSISFMHSVNKTEVKDFYEIRKDGIYVVRTLYYDFGAGVQTELEEGQSLEYTDDGGMLISGFNRRMDNLAYVVGMVSDHIMEFKGESYSLRNVCGRGSLVNFSLEKNKRR